MGQDFTAQLGQPTGGIMGPTPQAVAGNAPTPQMQNLARGQDPMANGMGSINPSLPGAGKGQRAPGMPRPQAPGPATGGFGDNHPVLANIARALMARKNGGMQPPVSPVPPVTPY